MGEWGSGRGLLGTHSPLCALSALCGYSVSSTTPCGSIATVTASPGVCARRGFIPNTRSFCAAAFLPGERASGQRRAIPPGEIVSK